MSDASSQFTRLVQAIKGTDRLSNSKARVVISSATTRDQLTQTAITQSGSVLGQAGGGFGINGVVSITDPSGNKYALLDIAGFADGATLY